MRGLAAASLTALVAVARHGQGHEFRPALLDVTALGAGRYEVSWVPAPGGERARVVLPERCVREASPAGEEGQLVGDGQSRTGPLPAAGSGGRRVFDCGSAGLAGERITVLDLAPLRDEALLRLHLEDGVEATAMLSAGRPSFEVPATPSRHGTAAQPGEGTAARSATAMIGSYALAGAAHLVTGLDHVLFLMGLLFLVRGARAGNEGVRQASEGRDTAGTTVSHAPGGARALFLAVTAFTAAHSLSLALQVLGAVRLPPAPVEAAIALSVLFVAREILRPPSPPTLAQRRPYVVTFGFGLLHGLGFAGGLTALQVPRAEVPAALFGFNVGLEIAQVALVGIALVVGAVVRPTFERLPAWTRRLPAYSLGAAAAFWLLTRTAAFWS